MHKLLFAAALALVPAPAFADTLIRNVNGIQVGNDGRLQRFTALQIGDDGRVTRVYAPDADQLIVTGRTRMIDGGGRTLLPGLIDAHGHAVDAPGGLGLGLLLQQLDLSGVTSISDLQRRLADYASANPDLPWIVGRGWNQELWADKRIPQASDLDVTVTDRPVWLVRVDGHAAVGNSAALKAAGMTAATRDPDGGRIERHANGNPNGIFIDRAKQLVERHIPEIRPDQMDQALDAAQSALLAHGVTAVADMGTSPRGWAAMERLGRQGRLKVRIIGYSNGLQTSAGGFGMAPTPWLYDDRLRLVGVKLYTDGSLGSRSALLKEPYADKPDTRGIKLLSDADLREQAGRAAAAGFQLAIHAIGDAANAQVISAYESLGRANPGDRRWRIEHFQVADPADIPRLAPAGIIASMQPTHQTSDRTMAEARLGPDRLDGAYAWQTVLRSGARIAFGSDFPVESPNPFPGLAAAISRQDMNGEPSGGWLPHERVSFAQALSGFTRDAAYAGFAEQKIGSLEPGKWADFIIVDRDVSAVSPLELGRTRVLETWIAGEKVFDAATAGGERG